MATLKWRQLEVPDGCVPRGGHALVQVFNKTIYCIAGTNRGGYIDTLHEFDASSGTWKRPIRLPFAPRQYFGAGVVGGKLWIFGGSDRDETFDDVWVMDCRNGCWERQEISGATHLLKRTGAGVVRSPLERTTLLIQGGYGPSPDSDKSVFHSQLVQLDTRRLSVKLLQPRAVRPRPTERAYHSLSVIGTHLVVYGGKHTDRQYVKDDVLAVFDVSKRRWSMPDASGPSPGPLSSHRATPYDDGMLLFGGHDPSGTRHNELSTLRLEDGEWKWSRQHQPAIGSRPPVRASCGLVLLGSDLYVMGGYQGDRYLRDMWALSLTDEVADLQPAIDGSERQHLAEWHASKRRRAAPLDSLPHSGSDQENNGAVVASVPASPEVARPARPHVGGGAAAAVRRTEQLQHSEAMKAVEAELARVRTERDTARAQEEEQRQRAGTLQDQLDVELERVTEAGVQRQRLEEQIGRMRLDEEQSSRSRHHVQEQLDAATAARDLLSTQKRELEDRLAQAEQQAREQERQAGIGRLEANGMIQKLEVETAARADALRTCQAEVVKAKAELADVQAKFSNDRENFNKGYTDLLNSSNREKAAWLEERAELQESVRKHTHTTEDLDRKLQQMRERCEAACAAQAKAEASVGTLDAKCRDLEARHAEDRELKVKAESRVLQLERDRAQLANNLSQIKETSRANLLIQERFQRTALEAIQGDMKHTAEQLQALASL